MNVTCIMNSANHFILWVLSPSPNCDTFVPFPVKSGSSTCVGVISRIGWAVFPSFLLSFSSHSNLSWHNLDTAAQLGLPKLGMHGLLFLFGGHQVESIGSKLSFLVLQDWMMSLKHSCGLEWYNPNTLPNIQGHDNHPIIPITKGMWNQ